MINREHNPTQPALTLSIRNISISLRKNRESLQDMCPVKRNSWEVSRKTDENKKGKIKYEKGCLLLPEAECFFFVGASRSSCLPQILIFLKTQQSFCWTFLFSVYSSLGTWHLFSLRFHFGIQLIKKDSIKLNVIWKKKTIFHLFPKFSPQISLTLSTYISTVHDHRTKPTENSIGFTPQKRIHFIFSQHLIPTFTILFIARYVIQN